MYVWLELIQCHHSSSFSFSVPFPASSSSSSLLCRLQEIVSLPIVFEVRQREGGDPFTVERLPNYNTTGCFLQLFLLLLLSYFKESSE